MPGLDGMELPAHMSGRTAALPIVFLSAQDNRAIDAFGVGAMDYLLKPSCPARLARSIDRILDGQCGSQDRGAFR